MLLKPTINLLACLPLLGLLSGCDLFEFSPQEVRIKDEEKNLNNRYFERIQAAIPADEDTMTFILVADTQRRYDETEDFVDAVNNMTDVDFVLHGGDLTDFGILQEYQWQHDILKELNVPYITVLG